MVENIKKVSVNDEFVDFGSNPDMVVMGRHLSLVVGGSGAAAMGDGRAGQPGFVCRLSLAEVKPPWLDLILKF